MKLFLYSLIKISLLPITTLIDVWLFVFYVSSGQIDHHDPWGTYYLTDLLWDSL